MQDANFMTLELYYNAELRVVIDRNKDTRCIAKCIAIQVFHIAIRFLAYSGLIRAQNDDGPFKWANGPYPIQIHANFQILIGHLKLLWALCKI